MPVVIIASEATPTPTAPLQKKLGIKEMRLASEDLIKDFFSCGKDDGTCPLFPLPDRS